MKNFLLPFSLRAGTLFSRGAAFLLLALCLFAAACSPREAIREAAEKIDVASKPEPEVGDFRAAAAELRSGSMELARLSPEEFYHEMRGDEEAQNPLRAASLVFLAAYCGETELLKALVGAGADVNCGGRFSSVFGAVIWAAKTGDAGTFDYLLEKGADVNARWNGGVTPLMIACSFEKGTALAERLLSCGADVEAKSVLGSTAASAVFDDEKRAEDALCVKKLELLLARGARADQASDSNWTPLSGAVWLEMPESVRFLLSHGAEASIGVRAKDFSALKSLYERSRRIFGLTEDTFNEAVEKSKLWASRTPLGVACARGNAEIVKILLEAGAPADDYGMIFRAGKGACVEERETGEKISLLDEALEKGDTEIAELLSAAGAKMSAGARKKLADALFAAVRGGNAELVRKFLADPKYSDVADLRGETGAALFSAAAEGGRFEIVRLLSDAGAFAAKPEFLCAAVRGGNAECVKFFLEKGASASAGTPLSIAVARGNVEIAKLLIAHGALADADALASAVSSVACGEEMISLLRESGAAVAPRALSVAAGRGNAEMIRRMAPFAEIPEKDLHDALTAAAENGNMTAFAEIWRGGAGTRLSFVRKKQLLQAALKSSASASEKAGAVKLLGSEMKDALDAALLDAALRRNDDDVRALVAAGANPNAMTENGKTPLDYCVRGTDAYLALVEAGGKRGAEIPRETVPAPHEAASGESVSSLAGEYGISVSELMKMNPRLVADSKGRSRALREGEIVFVPKTVSGGNADSSAALAAHRAYLLFHYAGAGDAENVRGLLDRGVPADARDVIGQTPLHVAVAYHRKPIMKLLIERGADVNAVSATGWTPLHGAAYWGDEEATEMLIAAGAAKSLSLKVADMGVIRGEMKRYCRANGFSDAVYEANVRANRKNALRTPLAVAVEHNRKDAAEVLLKAGADPDDVGYVTLGSDAVLPRPLVDVAAKNGFGGVEKLLKKYRAKRK